MSDSQDRCIKELSYFSFAHFLCEMFTLCYLLSSIWICGSIMIIQPRSIIHIQPRYVGLSWLSSLDRLWSPNMIVYLFGAKECKCMKLTRVLLTMLRAVMLYI